MMERMLLITTGGDYETLDDFASARECWKFVFSPARTADPIAVQTMTGLAGFLGADCKVLFVTSMSDYQRVKASVEKETPPLKMDGVVPKMKIAVNKEKGTIITKIVDEKTDVEIASVAMDGEDYIQALVKSLPNSVMDALLDLKERVSYQ